MQRIAPAITTAVVIRAISMNSCQQAEHLNLGIFIGTGSDGYAFMSLQRFAIRPKIQRAIAEIIPMTAKGIHTLAFT